MPNSKTILHEFFEVTKRLAALSTEGCESSQNGAPKVVQQSLEEGIHEPPIKVLVADLLHELNQLYSEGGWHHPLPEERKQVRASLCRLLRQAQIESDLLSSE